MALVKCKECSCLVSNTAKSCPNCGAKPHKKVGILGWFFVIFIVLPVAWSIGKNMGSDPVPAVSESTSSTSNSTRRAAEAPRSNWDRSELKNAMTDELTVVVYSSSKNATVFEFPYKQPGGSRLTLNFRKTGKSLDAYLRIDRGQMLCSSLKCAFNLRVGDGPVQKWTGLPTTTHDSDLMFIRDARQLEAIVKSGKPFRIGVEFYKAGERVFEFDPAGYPGI